MGASAAGGSLTSCAMAPALGTILSGMAGAGLSWGLGFPTLLCFPGALELVFPPRTCSFFCKVRQSWKLQNVLEVCKDFTVVWPLEAEEGVQAWGSWDSCREQGRGKQTAQNQGVLAGQVGPWIIGVRERDVTGAGTIA